MLKHLSILLKFGIQRNYCTNPSLIYPLPGCHPQLSKLQCSCGEIQGKDQLKLHIQSIWYLFASCAHKLLLHLWLFQSQVFERSVWAKFCSVSDWHAEAAAPDFGKHLEHLLQVIYPIPPSLVCITHPCLGTSSLMEQKTQDGPPSSYWAPGCGMNRGVGDNV